MMQNILDRLAKANKAQTKLNKSKNLLKGRKVHLSLKDDLDAQDAVLRASYEKSERLNVEGAVSDIVKAVETLKSAMSVYMTMADDYEKFNEIYASFRVAAEELGLTDYDFEGDMLDSDVNYSFEYSNELVNGDLTSAQDDLQRIISGWPNPYL
jgi:molecular chaperone GrpE (heat shock protein)